MKKITSFILLSSLLMGGLASCTKEKQDKVYSPVGYWRGGANVIHTAVLNRADGSARIYFSITGVDTANSTKADGFYTVSGNSYKIMGIRKQPDPGYPSDSIYLETSLESDMIMKGQLYTSYAAQIVDCTLRKQ